MYPHLHLQSLHRFFALRLAITLCFLASVVGTFAQTDSSGTITGRVLNPTTNDYVRNAEIRVKGTDRMVLSEDGGFYRMPDVPAGPVVISVTYTGFETSEATVDVPTQSSAVHDFVLQVRGGAAGKAGSALTLDQFVVVADRSGQSKAIMEQRNSMNMSNVVATDVFGDIAEGNVGEFLKFMPGVTLDYVEADTRAASIGGLDAKYVGVTMDGSALASASSSSFGDSSRQFEFEQVSINSIETIEVNKTVSADMDGDTPAGSINLRTKSGFDQKGRRIAYNFSVSANSYEMTTARTEGPGDKFTRKIRPNAVLDYSEAFLNNRLGVRATLSHSESYKNQFRLAHTFDNNATRGLLINRITYKDGPKLTTRESGTLRLDYKVGPRTTARLIGAYGVFDDDIHNRNYTFRANTPQLDSTSTLTRIATTASGTNTRLETSGDSFHKIGSTVSLSGELNTRYKSFRGDAKGSYSSSKNRYEDIDSGYFGSVGARVTRMSFLAQRSKASSTAWNLTQLTGRDWTNLDNYNRDDSYGSNVESTSKTGKTQIFGAEGNLRWDGHWRVPVWVKTGVKTRLNVKDVNDPIKAARYTYVGPAGGTSTVNATGMVASPFNFDPEKGGNIGGLNLPYPSRQGMYELFKNNPNYFAPVTGGSLGDDLRRLAGSNRDIKEQINSAYLMGDVKPLRRMELQAGVRVEQTRQTLTVDAPFSEAEMTARGFPVSQNSTPAYIAAQYGAPRDTHWKILTHVLPSASAKYRLSPNLIAHAAYSKSIGRPNVNRLAGLWEINEDDNEITLPNPRLTPEPFHTYSGRLEYYFEPAGSLTLGYFERHSNSLATDPVELTPEEVAILLEDRPIFAGYTFFAILDTERTKRVTKSLEIEYAQQFNFLPKPFNGLSGFVTFTRNIPNYRRKTPPKVLTAGLGYAYRAFSSRIKSTWTDRTYDSSTRYRHARFLVDVDANYKVSQVVTLFAAGRNVFNEAISWYHISSPHVLAQHEQFGVLWTLGVRGAF